MFNMEKRRRKCRFCGIFYMARRRSKNIERLDRIFCDQICKGIELVLGKYGIECIQGLLTYEMHKRIVMWSEIAPDCYRDLVLREYLKKELA